MEVRLKLDCSQHTDVFDCPDALVCYSARFDEYGLLVHDGGTSYIIIEYCPWCGVKLPDSKRDEWFDRLEGLGYVDPSHQNIPDEFKTGAWYEQKKTRE
jgi:Domain of unknown function (DUF6980)